MFNLLLSARIDGKLLLVVLLDNLQNLLRLRCFQRSQLRLHGIDGFDALFFRFLGGVGWMRRGVCGGLDVVVVVVVVVRAGGLLIDSRRGGKGG